MKCLISFYILFDSVLVVQECDLLQFSNNNLFITSFEILMNANRCSMLQFTQIKHTPHKTYVLQMRTNLIGDRSFGEGYNKLQQETAYALVNDTTNLQINLI